MPQPPTHKALAAQLRAVGITNLHNLARFAPYFIARETFHGTRSLLTRGYALYRSDPDHVPGWGHQNDTRIVLHVRLLGGSKQIALREAAALVRTQATAHLGGIAWEACPWKPYDSWVPVGTIARALALNGDADAALPEVSQ